MKILILGAAGKTGFELVTQALHAGHHVTGFVRDKSHLRLGDRRLNLTVGDARNVHDIAEALEGQDAVVSALGSLKAGDQLLQRSTEALVAAMNAEPDAPKRIIMLSSYVLTPNYQPTRIYGLINRALKKVYSDKLAGEHLLKQSGLDWTIVYASTFYDKAESTGIRFVKPKETLTPLDKIPRADAARFMLDLIPNKKSIRKSVIITGKN